MSSRPNQHLDKLVKAFSVLESKREIAKFLNDLLSPRELEMIPQRWAIIAYLWEGLTYPEIQVKARANSKKVGTATIVRAKRALDESDGGFTIALKRTSSGRAMRRR